VLPSTTRLTKPAEFAAVVKLGRRAGTEHLAVHLLVSNGAGSADLDSNVARPPRAGFVVSSKVGNSVIRHRVTRRLRAEVRPLLGTLAAGTDIVVRAFPAAATATSASLAADLRYAINKVRPLVAAHDVNPVL
jgi:ribonuclease P protein component